MDEVDQLRINRRIGAIHLAGIARSRERIERAFADIERAPGIARAAHKAEHANAKRIEHAARDCTRRHPRRRLARAGALERSSTIGREILQASREIRVTGPRSRHRRRLGWIIDAAVFVDDAQRNWRADRAPLPQSAEKLCNIALHLLPRAASVATLPARKLTIDARCIDGEIGRQPVDDGDKRRTVRFACSLVAQWLAHADAP